MGVREIDRSSGTMADGSQGLAAACDSGSHTPGAGKVVRHPAAGPGLDGSGDGGGAGAGTPTLSDVGRRPSAREGLRP